MLATGIEASTAQESSDLPTATVVLYFEFIFSCLFCLVFLLFLSCFVFALNQWSMICGKSICSTKHYMSIIVNQIAGFDVQRW